MGPGIFREYKDLQDEDVVSLAKKGDRRAVEYLLVKYKRLVSLRARSYFLKGASREDIVQEGMIGLYKAILNFRPENLVSFHAFAEMCLTRRMLTAIKAATRQKHMFLNSYVSLDKPVYDDDMDRSLLDVFAVEGSASPEELFIKQEELEAVRDLMGQILTDFEWEVLLAFLDEKSYLEIAETMQCNVKAVDNALQRVKKKLARHFQLRDRATY